MNSSSCPMCNRGVAAAPRKLLRVDTGYLTLSAAVCRELEARAQAYGVSIEIVNASSGGTIPPERMLELAISEHVDSAVEKLTAVKLKQTAWERANTNRKWYDKIGKKGNTRRVKFK